VTKLLYCTVLYRTRARYEVEIEISPLNMVGVVLYGPCLNAPRNPIGWYLSVPRVGFNCVSLSRTGSIAPAH
jgi:hypothetical protein